MIGANAVGYTSTMVGLHQLWYTDYPKNSFHFFNDNAQWLQMDKVGHTFSCYYEGLAGIEMMKWAGYNKKQYSLIGGAYGLFIQTGVEILDGFSAQWGASYGDMIANLVGTGMVVAQSYYWDNQRLLLKYSFSPSQYASYRPSTLGTSILEQILKDYNGQTYWLSCNIHSFYPECKWPKWLNMAIGYGADGLIGGENNFFQKDQIKYDYNHIKRVRQFYLSPDIDLSKFKSNHKILKSLAIVFNCLKFPMPTIEYNKESGISGHWILF